MPRAPPRTNAVRSVNVAPIAVPRHSTALRVRVRRSRRALAGRSLARMEEQEPGSVGGLAAQRGHRRAGRSGTGCCRTRRRLGSARTATRTPTVRLHDLDHPSPPRTHGELQHRAGSAPVGERPPSSVEREQPRRPEPARDEQRGRARARSAAAAAGLPRADPPGSPASTASSSTVRRRARGRGRSVRRSVVSSPQAAPFDADSTSTVLPIAPLTRRSTRKVKIARPSPRSRRSIRRPTKAPSVWARRLRGSGIAHEHACAGVAVVATTATAATMPARKSLMRAIRRRCRPVSRRRPAQARLSGTST